MLHALIATRHCITGHLYYGIDFVKSASPHSLTPNLRPKSRPLRPHRTAVEYINIHETRSYGVYYFLISDTIPCSITYICRRLFAYQTLAFWFWLAGYATRIGVLVTYISCYIQTSTCALGRGWRDVIGVVRSKELWVYIVQLHVYGCKHSQLKRSCARVDSCHCCSQVVTSYLLRLCGV